MGILIYEDYVHNNGALYRALCRHFGDSRVGFADAGDVHDGILNDKIRLFVMPGGADLFYCEKLNGAGNKAIRRWVEQGGTYLGICAGAYYACASLEWAKGTAQEISGPRELAFFNGKAVGPIGALTENGNADKSWNAAVKVVDDTGTEATVHYNGGPLFEGTPDTVLVRYSTLPGKPAAAIECKVGSGRALLCSFHPETTPQSFAAALYTHNNGSWTHDCRVATLLTPHGGGMKAVRDRIFDRAAPDLKQIAA